MMGRKNKILYEEANLTPGMSRAGEQLPNAERQM
jgi:hypothetical protein